VADTIRSVAEPLPAAAKPLDLSLRSACALAEAVARKDEAAAAWAALPPAVQARYGGGQPDSAFEKLYEALQETEPKM
jgi:hypothetical protein